MKGANLKKPKGLDSGEVLRRKYKRRRLSPAEKVNMVMELLGGQPILDDCGCPTGEISESLISIEDARKLLSIKNAKTK